MPNTANHAIPPVYTTKELCESRSPFKHVNLLDGQPVLVVTNQGPMVSEFHGFTRNRHLPRVRLRQEDSIRVVEENCRVRNTDTQVASWQAFATLDDARRCAEAFIAHQSADRKQSNKGRDGAYVQVSRAHTDRDD
jgi:hypothetical protein